MKNKQFLVLMLLVTMCSSAVPVSAIDVTGSTSSGVASNFSDVDNSADYSNILVSLPTNLDLSYVDSTDSFHKTSQVSAKGDMKDDWTLRVSVEDITYTASGKKADANVYFGDDKGKMFTLFTASELAASKSVADERQLDIDVDKFNVQGYGDYNTNVIFNINLGDIHSNPSPESYFDVGNITGDLDLVWIVNTDSVDTIVIPDRLSGVSSEHYKLMDTRGNVRVGTSSVADSFLRDTGYKTVVFPKKITQGFSTSGLLNDNNTVQKIVLPESGLTSIASYSFCNSSSVKDIVIPTGVETIEDNAFYNLRNVDHIYLPDTVTFIGSGAFTNCGLKEFTIPKGVVAFSLSSFCPDDGIYNNATMSSLEEFNIPSTCEYLYADSPVELSGLSKLTIPSGLKVISNQSIIAGVVMGSMDEITIEDGTNYTGDSFFFDGKCKKFNIGASSGFTFKLWNDDAVINVSSGAALNPDSIQGTFKEINLKSGIVFNYVTLDKNYKITKSGETLTFNGSSQELKETGLYYIDCALYKDNTWVCTDKSVVPSSEFLN